jgi:hypothetical protein
MAASIAPAAGACNAKNVAVPASREEVSTRADEADPGGLEQTFDLVLDVDLGENMDLDGDVRRLTHP